MSHIVQLQTEIRDPVAVKSACNRMGLPVPTHRTVQLYSAEATGLAVELPGWRYPVVCQTETSEIFYDSYEGRWGSQEFLDQLLQMYSVEKAKIEARKKGHTVTEQRLDNGSIKLTVSVGGAA